MSAMDAGRNDVYVGEYEVSASPSQTPREYISTRSEFLTQAKGWSVVTPDPALGQAALEAGLSVSKLQPISAADVARVGWRRIQSGKTVAPEELEANYIRRTMLRCLKEFASSMRVRRATRDDIRAIAEVSSVRVPPLRIGQTNTTRAFFETTLPNCPGALFLWLKIHPRQKALLDPSVNLPCCLPGRAMRRWRLGTGIYCCRTKVSASRSGNPADERLIRRRSHRNGRQIFLEVRESNQSARELYRKPVFARSGLERVITCVLRRTQFCTI